MALPTRIPISRSMCFGSARIRQILHSEALLAAELLYALIEESYTVVARIYPQIDLAPLRAEFLMQRGSDEGAS
ncbi:hypothetical protein HC891_20315 [Candidatus Gracilibacteria bacterium]|nr:hypothetical protein [Candidatus Gracilibacteria bacterium]